MEDDSNSRFGLADDDELAGFDIDAAIASSSTNKEKASSSSLFQQAIAPNSLSVMTSLSVAEKDNNSGTENNNDSFKTALTSEIEDNELALDIIDNTMSHRLSKVGETCTLIDGNAVRSSAIDQCKRSVHVDDQLPPPAKRWKLHSNHDDDAETHGDKECIANEGKISLKYFTTENRKDNNLLTKILPLLFRLIQSPRVIKSAKLPLSFLPKFGQCRWVILILSLFSHVRQRHARCYTKRYH
jgi:hypothetical protein